MSYPYVLKFGGKNPVLTKILHLWFDYLKFPPPNGKKDWISQGGTFTKETEEMVKKYQLARGIVPPNKRPYGQVSAVEWQYLGEEIGYRAFDQNVYTCIYHDPRCNINETTMFLKNVGGYNENSLSGGIHIYGPLFMKFYFEEFGGMDPVKFDGLAAFLNFMRTDTNLTDIRHAAYMMATVQKETGGAWLPKDEDGKGAGRSYGKPVAITCGNVVYTHTWYGRGYVQLTGGGLYKEISEKMGMKCELVKNPELAKLPETAYKILSNGMKDGWYIPKQYLSKYISGKTCDYLNARNIVNTKLDSAKQIEDYAKLFESYLRSSMFR